jgi:galactose oxidase
VRCRMNNLAISVWVVGLAALSRTCAAAVVPLPTTGWTITADSFQVGYEPAKALDGQTKTAWRSTYSSVATPYPHFLVVDMKSTQTVAGIDYLPRQATTTTNGNIGQYEVALSADGTTWGPAVATGTWDGTSAVKQVRLATPATGQYIRLLALSEYRAGKPWANAAEITVYGMQTLLQTAQAGLP